AGGAGDEHGARLPLPLVLAGEAEPLGAVDRPLDLLPVVLAPAAAAYHAPLVGRLDHLDLVAVRLDEAAHGVGAQTGRALDDVDRAEGGHRGQAEFLPGEDGGGDLVRLAAQAGRDESGAGQDVCD